MGTQKTATATAVVIRSLLWSIAVTFAILGLIERLLYSGDFIPYFIISGIFGVLWALSRKTKISGRRDVYTTRY